MAWIQMDFESEYLGCGHMVSVLLPDRPRQIPAREFYENGRKYKVLWLLHGTHGDHSDWLRRTMIEVYAREKNLIVVMPSALNSDYVNWDRFGTGFYMGDYLTEELMPLIQNWFPASDKQEDNYIAGLSMGGAGALQYILKHPDRFAAGAVLSYAPGEVDTEEGWNSAVLLGDDKRWKNQVANCGGKEAYLNSEENTFRLVREINREHRLPKLYFCCGTEDFLYERYNRFKKMCQEEQIPVTFEEAAGYKHEWRFWDLFIQKALEFFCIEDEGAEMWKGAGEKSSF